MDVASRRGLLMVALGVSLGAPLVRARNPSDSGTEDYPRAYYQKPEPSALRQARMQLMLSDSSQIKDVPPMAAMACVAGDAGGYPCQRIDLEAFLPLSAIGGGNGNDIWGWTDPLSGKEYALVGRSTGSSFIDVSDPQNPVFLGDLPTHTVESAWRDIKVYADHAFIVADNADAHGMQVFDLTALRSVVSPPVTFSETAHYAMVGSAHNLAINEATGYAYLLGSGTCAGGPHVVNLQVPTAPSMVGCVDADGYTHDSQCVTYNGPDAAYAGRPLCINFNEDTVTIVDVSDPLAPLQISRTDYPGRAYTHQGWLSPDHRLLIVDDELDEARARILTSTHFWDVRDLDAPVHIGVYQGATLAIDHNQYIRGNYAYQSNYRNGLRILELCCGVSEVAFFDVYPENDNTGFSGTWSNYPYFQSGIVIVNSIDRGLFVLRPVLPGSPTCGDLLTGDTGAPLSRLANALRAHRVGNDVRLTIVEAPPAGGGFNLFRATSRAIQGALLGQTPTTVTRDFSDAGAVADGFNYYYQARSVSACGLAGP